MVHGFKGIFEAKRGDVFGLQFDEAWTRLLQKGGWWAPSYKTFEELWKLIQERGGWWDPLYDFGEWERVFQTPSKKFEFYAQGLKRMPSSPVSKSEWGSILSPSLGRTKEDRVMKRNILFTFIFSKR